MHVSVRSALRAAQRGRPSSSRRPAWHPAPGSRPLRHGRLYQVIPYPALLVVVLLPTAWSVAMLLRGLARYWRDVHGPLLRVTPAFGLILVIHLATIVVCFSIAPYTRFVHAGYRFLALVADAIEQRRPGSVA